MNDKYIGYFGSHVVKKTGAVTKARLKQQRSDKLHCEPVAEYRQKAVLKSYMDLSPKGRKEDVMENNSFTQFDYAKAKKAFNIWNERKTDDLDDYVMRERKRELQFLIKKVINNELSEKDRLLVSLHWYKGKTKQEIAELVGVDRSTIFRRFEKINDIIYEKLRYAIEYRYGDSFAPDTLLLLKRDVTSVGINGLESIGERLARLRKEQFLTKEDVCSCTGISQKRLDVIEKRGKEITMTELRRLASFFRVSSDYIIFGQNRVLRDEETGRPVVSFS